MASCSSSSSGNATASSGWSLTVARVPAALAAALGCSGAHGSDTITKPSSTARTAVASTVAITASMFAADDRGRTARRFRDHAVAVVQRAQPREQQRVDTMDANREAAASDGDERVLRFGWPRTPAGALALERIGEVEVESEQPQRLRRAQPERGVEHQRCDVEAGRPAATLRSAGSARLRHRPLQAGQARRQRVEGPWTGPWRRPRARRGTRRSRRPDRRARGTRAAARSDSRRRRGRTSAVRSGRAARGTRPAGTPPGEGRSCERRCRAGRRRRAPETPGPERRPSRHRSR